MTTVDTTNAVAAATGVKNGKPGDAGPSTVRRSAGIAALAAAMVKAQAAIEDPTKNKRADAGGRGSYRYADLPTVLDVVRPALSANGLAVMQFPCEHEGHAAVTTLLVHTSGEWVETVALLRPVKTDPQGVGSALTYMRRYSLLSLCGIAADDDDDGAAASRTRQQQPAQEQPGASNPRLRAEAAQALAQCDTREAYLAVCKQIAEDVRAGRMSMADRDALAPVARDTAARFPEPAGAK